MVVDVITVAAYKCTHCKAIFPDRDSALEHLDGCDARRNALGSTDYIEKDFGNMILKEGAV